VIFTTTLINIQAFRDTTP